MWPGPRMHVNTPSSQGWGLSLVSLAVLQHGQGSRAHFRGKINTIDTHPIISPLLPESDLHGVTRLSRARRPRSSSIRGTTRLRNFTIRSLTLTPNCSWFGSGGNDSSSAFAISLTDQP